jgi:hypothetical protein
MYTDAMRRAFHSIVPPGSFSIDLVDNDHFLTIKLSEKSFLNMTHDEKIEAVRYVTLIKKALEMEGAIVLVTREPLQ